MDDAPACATQASTFKEKNMSENSKVTVVERSQTSPPANTCGRGITGMFGLEPRAAFLFFGIDVMVFGADALTLGALIPVGIVVGAVLGFIVYKIQRKYYGDDHDAALIKCVTVGLLTAIPLPLGPFFAVPAGLLGIVKSLRRK
jgi:hypothetical protein